MSPFALFYIMAQLVERLAEGIGFFLDLFLGPKKAKSHTRKTDAFGKLIGWPQKNQDGTTTSIERTFFYWGLSSILGVVLVWLLGMTGVNGKTPGPGLIKFVGSQLGDNLENLPTWVDYVFSGIVIGAGTKPLHDLISLMEKKGDKNP